MSKTFRFVPLKRNAKGTLKILDLICACGCDTKFKKKQIASQSIQVKHFLDREHYKNYLKKNSFRLSEYRKI